MEMVIGNKAFSSWSLRPWMVLKRIGEPFTETPVRLRLPTTADEIARHSPSGQIPVLKDGDTVVWDSLAICEYLAERFPNAGLWPADMAARAIGRSAVAEMHGYRADRPIPSSLAITQLVRPLGAGAVCVVTKKDGPCLLDFRDEDGVYRLVGFEGDLSLLRPKR